MTKFKNLINKNLDIAFYIILISLKIIVYGAFVGSDFSNFISVIIPTFASVIALCSISLLFNKKTRARLLYTFNIIISSMIVADLIYFNYFRDILCVQVIQNGKLLGSVKSSVNNLFNPIYLLFFIDFFIRPYKFYERDNIIEKPMSSKVISFLILFLIGGGLNASSIYALSKQQPKLISTMYNRMYIAKNLGNLNFHTIDIYNSAYNTIRKHQPLPAEKENEIKNYLTKQPETQTNALKGEYKGKNLIIIQVEALQEFVINETVNGNEITPNLNKLINKSLYFDNYFYQVGSGNTSDAEFMTNNSLYPAAQGVACYLYSNNELKSLPKALKDIGYNSAAFHAYKENFWNRNVMNNTEGFDNFYGENSFNIDEIVGMGLSDKSFFDQSLEKMKQMSEPYYAFLTTLTSHFPFDDVDNYGEFNVGDELEGTFLGNYLKSVHYTDEQIGMFFRKLEEEGIANNSIIAIYGDHHAIPKKEESNLCEFLNIENPNELSWMQLQKVPLLIHFPEDKHKGINNIYSGQMDLYPTIANLFDLPENNLMGKDLLNSKEGNVIFRDGSFTDGNIFYISSSNTYYNIKTGEKIEENGNLKDKKDDAINQLEYSDAILDHNLFKKYK